MQPVPKSMRLVQAASALLLALNVGLTALLFDRLPETIATKWSATGMANSAGHRDLAWLGPMCLAFIIALGLVSRRHIKSHERWLVDAVFALATLYMFSLNMLALLANVDNEDWQQGSVGGRWMLLALIMPALVFAAGLSAYRARSSRR